MTDLSCRVIWAIIRAFLQAVAAIWLACFLLSGSGCTKRERPVDEGVRTRTLLVGNQNEPSTLDPHVMISHNDFRIATALFEGLTVLDEKTAQPLPGVAERWNVSPDGLMYTFHLRPNAKWSDGERVTAGDFAYSFQRSLTPGLGSSANLLWSIKNAEAFNTGKLTDFDAVGVAAIDDSTLRVTLERPTPYLLALATWFPVSRRTVEKFGRMDARDSSWTRPGNLVGNGAFTLTEWRPNARIVVTHNPHYWGAAQNKIERVIFLPMEKADAEELNFRAGQLHVTFSLPASKIATYRQQSPERLRLDPVLSTFFLNFNVTKPPLNNPKVRRALALAIDRQAISARIYELACLPAHSLVPDGCPGYVAPAGQPDDFAAARALLVEAGFPGGRGLPTIALQVPNDERAPKAAEVLQAMWQRELGVQITIEMLEHKTLMQNQQTHAYTMGFLRLFGDYLDPNTFLQVYQSGIGDGFTGWISSDYDALMHEAANTLDAKKRLATLQRAESLLLEEAPIAPLVFNSRTFLIHPAVKNWQPALLGINRYQVVELRN